MLSEAQALHPPSHPPSQPPPNPPSDLHKGLSKEGQSQIVGQVQQRHTPHGRSGEDVEGRRQLLREHVVHVTEAAAGLPDLASSEAECKKVPIAKLQEYWGSFSHSRPPCLPVKPQAQHMWNLVCTHV